MLYETSVCKHTDKRQQNVNYTKKKTMKKTVALRNLYRTEFLCYNNCYNNTPTTKEFILDSTRVTSCISLQHVLCELCTIGDCYCIVCVFLLIDDCYNYN